jgi:hypothetical protein
VAAFNQRDEAALRRIDPAFAGLSSTSPRVSASDIVIGVAVDGQTATLNARLSTSPSGTGAAGPPSPDRVRWVLRKEGGAWRVAR